MKKVETTTIRIKTETKEELNRIKGQCTYDQILNHLVEFFLNKK